MNNPTPIQIVPPSDASGHAGNNFDIVRFVAASAVLFSHCYALTAHGGGEPLVIATRGEYAFGGLAVRVFFVISGYLVTQSWMRRPHALAFVAGRALRIFPALAAALLYGVLLGLVVTHLPKLQYLTHPDTWRYLWHNITLQTEFFLPGAFEDNPEPRAINGSLWSLFYEVRAYLVVLVIGLLGLLRGPRRASIAWCLAAALIFLYGAAWGISQANDWPVINAFICFVGGALLAVHPKIARSKWLGVVGLCALAAQPLLLGTRFSEACVDVLLIAGTIGFAYLRLPWVSNFGRYGDFSYGIFLFAFPTQQFVAWLGVSHEPMAMFALAFPLTLGLAALSWHFVERPCRDLKRLLRPRSPTPSGVPAQHGAVPVSR